MQNLKTETEPPTWSQFGILQVGLNYCLKGNKIKQYFDAVLWNPWYDATLMTVYPSFKPTFCKPFSRHFDVNESLNTTPPHPQPHTFWNFLFLFYGGGLPPPPHPQKKCVCVCLRLLTQQLCDPSHHEYPSRINKPTLPIIVFWKLESVSCYGTFLDIVCVCVCVKKMGGGGTAYATVVWSFKPWIPLTPML